MYLNGKILYHGVVLALLTTSISHRAHADNQLGVEVRAAKVCAGVGQTGWNAQGPLKVDNLSVQGDPNGTITVERDGVDLGKFDKGTYQDYTTCLMEMTKLLLTPSYSNGGPKQDAEEERRFLADAASLIDSLGDPSEAKRTAAAIALRPYAGNDRTQTFAVSALAYALGTETSPDVQQAIAASLVAAGAPSLDPLKAVVSRENGVLSAEFYKVGDACFGLRPDRANALIHIRARQTAVILAAEGISRIGKSAVDLSGARLKCYPFDGLTEQFDGAKFNDAVLTGASLYRKKLRNADLSDAEAIDTEFTFADMTGVTVTTKTDFRDALMECVTLTGAKGVTPIQLESLLGSAKSLAGARLDPEVAGSLKDKVNPPGAKPCEY
jgi:Pentapeptide repeats (8 copies)